MAKNRNQSEELEESRNASDERIERESNDFSFISEIKGASDDDDEDWWKDDEEYTATQRKELEALYNSTLRTFEENQIISGTVVSKTDKEILLNIGFKSEGIVSASEFRDLPNLKVGDLVEVLIESTEGKDGQLQLSRKRAKHMRTWELINGALDKEVILEGTVLRRTKGGFVVDIQGVEAFLPGSQIDVKPVRDFDIFVNRVMEFKVVKINHAYENVVVSHKILIEEKLEEQRQEILKNLEKGQVLEGVVKNMTPFGVFIDLGGVDGLLHITDISWGRISHPQEVLKLEDKVNVVVLDFDEDKKRISLGMKQLYPHPWDTLGDDLKEGAKVKGRVVTVADYGVFIEIKPGVEGLIHTSEMSWSQHVKNPTELFKPGDELEAVVLVIDREEKKMSLGLKQLRPDPWTIIVEKYAVATKHTGTVRNMTNYGLFVELEEGVDGLVHISDLSWTKKYQHPSEYTKIDDKIEVVVLAIDADGRKLSLGHKQLTEDVWETFATVFTIGSVQKGNIKKIDGKGAVVELEYGVEGICLSKNMKVAEGQAELSVDMTADFEVVEFNKDAKRILLSHTSTWLKSEDDERRAKKLKTVKPNTESNPQAGTLGDNEALAKLKEEMENGQ
ncbi:MAG: 30S ribosomal protein S1 [Bacteroidia bacterium]